MTNESSSGRHKVQEEKAKMQQQKNEPARILRTHVWLGQIWSNTNVPSPHFETATAQYQLATQGRAQPTLSI